MEIIFLGYSDINFVNTEGNKIDGIKFYFAYESDKSNYSGLQVQSYFADRVKDKLLCDIVVRCQPLTKYVLDVIPSFSGKTKIRSLTTVK